jgi:hypothetical protein
MRRRLSIVMVAAIVFSVVGVAYASTAGVPEIDRANATFNLKTSNTPSVIACAGEDGINYTKVTGTWKGMETEFTPGFTDYNLTGTLVWSGKAVWTINQTTDRGIFRAKAKLVDSSGQTAYNGSIVLITQGLPGTQTAEMRGWLNARTFIGGVADGGSVLANVDAIIQVGGSYPIRGLFGDAPPQLGYAPYSVTTINQTC